MSEDFLSGTLKIKNVEKMTLEEISAREVMALVAEALVQKGYSPLNQIVGYILSGDPTYITGHNNARNIITKLDRDVLLEVIVKFYLDSLK